MLLLLDVYEVCFDLIVYVFFFKQKTAYEMRISDWSSDVCSSDLELTKEKKTKIYLIGISSSLLVTIVIQSLVIVALLRYAHSKHEIGRASCRERVCQYV